VADGKKAKKKQKTNKQTKTKKTSCKTYTHPRHLAAADA